MNDFIFIVKNGTIRNVFISKIISEFGDWIAIVGVQTLLVFKLDASVWQVSLLFTFSLLPRIVIPPLIGPILDRGFRMKIYKFNRLLALLVSILYLFLNGNIYLLITITTLLNVLLSIEGPAAIGIVRQTIDERVDSVLGTFYFVSDAMKILGPLAAAPILVFLGIKWAFIFNSLTFLLAFIIIIFIPYQEEHPEIQLNSKDQGSSKFLETFITIFRNKTLLYVFIVTFVFLFSMNAIDANSVILVHSITNDKQFQAYFLSDIGFGGALGSLVTLYIIKKFRHINVSVIGTIIVGVLLCGVLFINNIFELLLAGFIIGFFAPSIIIPMDVLKQSSVDKKMSSRIAGVVTGSNSGAQLLGAASSGLLMYLFGSRGAFVFAGAIIFLLGIYGLFRLTQPTSNSETPVKRSM